MGCEWSGARVNECSASVSVPFSMRHHSPTLKEGAQWAFSADGWSIHDVWQLSAGCWSVVSGREKKEQGSRVL